MVNDHIKRVNAPKRWAVLRKNNVFITRPNAGRDFSLCIALNTALKEMIGKTQTTKESKYLIKNKGVLVNSKPVFDDKFPVGFLDVVSFPSLGEHFRLLVNKNNKLFFLKIHDEEAKLKLSKVCDKKNLTKSLAQINCSDGRNFTLKANDPLLKDISINDSVAYQPAEQKIAHVIKLEKGAFVYLYKGKHTGNVVVVEEFKKGNIIFKLDDEMFETKNIYAFAVGKEKPIISLNEKMSANEIPVKETKKETKTSKAQTK
jgi:small subunit ribosomal protein S4e